MGKGTDKLYITHSEWSSSDAFSASTGARTGANNGSFKRLPFNFCAASLQPFKNPVCTAEGQIFDLEVISKWLENHKTNPVNGEPLALRDLIKLNFARNGDLDSKGKDGSGGDGKGDLIDPVSFKVFTDNTHIVAIRHGGYANVFAWDTVERMNIKAKMWNDLVDDEGFGRSDIITLQDPQNAASRDLSQFKYLKDGEDALLTKEQEEERKEGNVNINALGRVGDKVLRAKVAVEKARREREAGGDVNRSKAIAKSSASNEPRQSMIQDKKQAYNAAAYTTGRAAASFTSTGLTPETSGERAVLTDEEYMLKPKRVKHKGYARMETNLGDLNIELQTEHAPKAVWNFIRLAEKGYYQNVAFHRNIRNFMIQGGDPSGTGRGGQSIWGKNFSDEFEGPLTHSQRGIMSMANKGKNTNSSQFFITYKPVKHLDNKHTIFGKVVGGLDVLSKMEDVPTDGSDRPLNKIVIKNIVVYIDPFQEFQKEKTKRDKIAEQKADVQRRGGTEDDRTTWTGKRVRDDGTVDQGNRDAGVGKYLKAAMEKQHGEANEIVEENVVDTWEEPVRKRAKSGGFGNFDGW
ncbi:peptidyl-prolyl cis-trans isomerase cyp8 [Pseudomassariella vexata]|uniref:Peptidyl-prolyl cis-trans isomerase-like 2 n=1 Tax=Pseudomassariella vexata TaxID=1141098 RepID=A0A1Y2DWQ4_9PEZI|nr:peptidyl-prolyl cis-trans isomerase cyp8 [Pseudomassariella vexata]ORY63534.1 peptidyl-prolyl cis-trans isomerase cyp8 [Pseudomassariella vexata]